MRAGKIVSGSENVIAALKKKKMKVVIIAKDLHENSAMKITHAAQGVNIINIFSSKELAHAIGKERKVLALSDRGFYSALTKQINEGV